MKKNTSSLRLLRYPTGLKMIVFFIYSFCYANGAIAQSTVTPIDLSADTNRVIEIIGANSLRQISLTNGTVLTTLAGQARVKQGDTFLSGDSIILDKQLGIAEIFGHVHINDADTVNTYADYLRYMGNEQKAYLKNQVKLTDGKAVLTTNELEYDIKTGIATYHNGGKVVNEKTVLTSHDAIYYSDTKDVFFQQDVKLKDPKYNMRADSLRYNTAFKTAYFIAPTHIVSDNGNIDTREGNYNLETGEAVFFDETTFRDSTHFMSGKKLAFDEKTNTIQVEGNGKLVDSVNNVMVLGNQILIDKKNNTFLATRKPVMIIYRNNDSTYITADTLFSGKRLNTDTTATKALSKDSLAPTISNIDLKKNNTDSISFFIGYHHVKIYNDSLQAVCDSMHYTSADSTFRLFNHPVCWNGNTQLTGDTMVLYTENQQAKRMYIYNNAMVVNRTNQGFFNQMAGKTINGYFIGGQLDYIRTKGAPAESIFYPQDEDSAYIGMNRSKSDVIDIMFVNKEINKIKFINEVSGTLYPIKKIPADKKELVNFSWLIARRPLNKMQIFE